MIIQGLLHRDINVVHGYGDSFFNRRNDLSVASLRLGLLRIVNDPQAFDGGVEGAVTKTAEQSLERLRAVTGENEDAGGS